MDAITGQAEDAAAALARRYGEAAVPPAGPWNGIVAALLAHRSVRAFRPDPLPPGTLETLVAAAQSAATSSNLQAWSVIAVHDPARRAALAAIADDQKHIEVCPLFLVFLADLSRLARLGEAEGKALPGLSYLEAFLVAAVDAALAAQNAVVAAEALGLSTVYIGALRNDVERVAALLELPKGAFAVFGLCVGHADPAVAAEVKPRLPQAAIVHHDRYVVPDEPALRAAYDDTLAAFSRRNGMGAADWTGRMIARIGTIKALRGRDLLRRKLNALGFPLE